MIGWIIKLAMWFAPILIRFIDKHSDTWLENTYKKIEKFLGKQAIETTFIFVDKNGNPIRNVRLEFEDDTHGKVSYLSSKDGSVVMYGFLRGNIDVTIFTENEEYPITVEIGDKTLQRIVL